MAWTALIELENLVDETFVSRPIGLHDGRTIHGLEFTVKGVGTVKITPYTSISGKDWVSNGAKVSGFGSVSGPGSDGVQILPLMLKPSELIKFSFEATGAIEVSAWFTQK